MTMKCLWCKANIFSLVQYGKKNPRMFQACDNLCAHDLCVMEQLDEILHCEGDTKIIDKDGMELLENETPDTAIADIEL